MGCYEAGVMFPFAIPALTSVAANVLDRWGRAAQPTAENQISAADFQKLLNTASAAGASSASTQGMAALPEVKAVLSSAGAGTPVQLEISPDGGLSRVLPGGGKQALPLSSQSQAIVRQWASANPGASSVSLVA